MKSSGEKRSCIWKISQELWLNCPMPNSQLSAGLGPTPGPFHCFLLTFTGTALVFSATNSIDQFFGAPLDSNMNTTKKQTSGSWTDEPVASYAVPEVALLT